MFTVKLVKYSSHSTNAPSVIEDMAFYEADTVHHRDEKDIGGHLTGRTVLQLGDAPGFTREFTLGGTDSQYNTAFVMNAAGRTVEKFL